ncbi:Armadillo repeat-containing protein 2 [Borealophlyctis nickersoniae]|nr:Armadillo repeat-containing protein 2 [Borealophlyctis nickersoniae]
MLRVLTALDDIGWMSHPAEDSGRGKKEWKKRRKFIVSEMVKWMDKVGTAEVAIAACGIVLRISQEERILVNTCKLLFKLSKNEKNDAHFRTFRVLESLLLFLDSCLANCCTSSTSASSSSLLLSDSALWDVMISSTGALKNACSDEKNMKTLGSLSGIEKLALAIESVMELNPAEFPDERLDQAVQLLIHLTTTLRDFASAPSHRSLFLAPFSSQSAATQTPLNVILRVIREDAGLVGSEELMLNVSRILSKLSLYPECVPHLGGAENVQALLQLVVRYQDDKPLLIRICFVLGTLTADVGEDGGQHLHVAKGMEDLVALLGLYAGVEIEKEDDENDDGGDDAGGEERGGSQNSENEDVLVKLIRLVANLALDPSVGAKLVGMIELETLLTEIACKPIEHHEELILNIVGALANFSFYGDCGTNCILQRRLEIATLLIPLLMHENVETVVESARVFGNLSREKAVRDILLCHRGTELFTILLDHPGRDVVFQACGVLMNLLGQAGAEEHRDVVFRNQGLAKLVDVFCSAVDAQDMPLAVVAGKTMHNLCTGGIVVGETELARMEQALDSAVELADSWSDPNDKHSIALRDLAGRLALDLLEANS